MKLPNLTDQKIADGTGFASVNFWTFLDSVQKWIRGAQLIQAKQADLAALAVKLKGRDAGILVEVTDYAHVLRWTGTAWQWGPGEEGGGFFRPFAVAPTGSGWVACNGANATYLKSDGTTGTVTLPNSAGAAAYMKLGAAYANATTAATVPTSTTPTFTGNAVTPAGTVSSIAATASTAVLVTSSGAVQVAAQGHTHAAPTFTGTPLTPTGTVSTPTIALPGDPVANFTAVLYFRQ